MIPCCQPRLSKKRKLPEIYGVRLNENQKNIWKQFLEFDTSPQHCGLDKRMIERYKVPVEVDYPFARVIADFAVDAFNKNWEMHVKKGEKNHIHDHELLECKYLKLYSGFYFFMTIEAVEEGHLGIYEVKVVCDRDDGRLTLSTFVFTNRAPFGKKGTPFTNMTRLRSICKKIQGLEENIGIYLDRERISGSVDSKTRHMSLLLVPLKQHCKEVLKDVGQELEKEPAYQLDCKDMTNRDYWDDPHDDFYSGLTRRRNRSWGYDFYVPLGNFSVSLLL